MEDIYHSIIEKAGEGVLVTQDYKIKFFNRAMLELSGYSDQELTEALFLDFIHPDDREFVSQQFQQRISGVKDKAQYRIRLRKKDHRFRVVLVNAVSFVWEGRPASLNFLSDITEQEEATLKMLIEGANNAVGVRDKNGYLIKWNEAFSILYMDLFGVEAALGQKPIAIPSELKIDKSNVINDTIKQVDKNEVEKFTFKHERPDGDVRYYEMALMATKANNRFYATVEVIMDVTSTMLYEQELSKQHRLLKEAQRIAHLGSWEWDLTRDKMEWTDEVYRIIGVSRQELEGSYDTFLQLVHPEDQEAVKTSVKRALVDPSFKYDIVHRIIRPDGTERTIRERAEMVYNDSGVAERMIGMAQDITSLKILEEEVRRLRQELSHIDRVNLISEMSTSLAHELNQPLSAILSNAQVALRVLEMESPELDDVKEILQDIVKDDKRASRVINSLRALLKKREPVDPAVDTWDVDELIGEVVNIVKSDVLIKGTQVQYEPSPGLPLACGNRVQTQQVLLNLVLNATDAMGDMPVNQSLLEIGVEQQEDQTLLVYVRDTGKGIGEDELPKIFEPFYTTKPNGLGMGLSICKTIITSQEGRLWAENNPEQGATFYFTLASVSRAQE